MRLISLVDRDVNKVINIHRVLGNFMPYSKDTDSAHKKTERDSLR